MHSGQLRRVTVAAIFLLVAAGGCARAPDPPPPVAETRPVAIPEASASAQSPATQPTATQPAETTKTNDYKPTVGQAGKDVVWVPTPQPLVDRMLDMAKLTPSDIHYDLGSGDGRTVITAVKRGARSTGVEYNPDMVALSKRLAQQDGVGAKAKFIEGDIFKTDFSDATVLTLFLLAELNVRLRPTILAMKPGTRVVSNTFKMGEWEPDESQTVTEKEGCTGYCTAHLWIVPAKVDGTWKTADGQLVLKQEFQMVSGTVTAGGKTTEVSGRLRGDVLMLNGGGAELSGKVSGNRIEGSMKNGSGASQFSATR